MKKHFGLIVLLSIIYTLIGCKSSDKFYQTTTATHFDGIDISRHQGIINWKEVSKEERVKFVYIKATEGGTYQDPHYKRNLREARKKGLKVGSYHFLRTTSSIWLQFLNIMTHIPSKKQDLVPMIDVEECKNWNAQQLQDSLSLLARLIEKEYGKKPVIYTGQNFFIKRLNNDKITKYPLWIARYGDEPPCIDYPYTIWQFTQKGNLKGVSSKIDLNRFAPGISLDILHVN
jgi:lysozyme